MFDRILRRPLFIRWLGAEDRTASGLARRPNRGFARPYAPSFRKSGIRRNGLFGIERNDAAIFLYASFGQECLRVWRVAHHLTVSESIADPIDRCGFRHKIIGARF